MNATHLNVGFGIQSLISETLNHESREIIAGLVVQNCTGAAAAAGEGLLLLLLLLLRRRGLGLQLLLLLLLLPAPGVGVAAGLGDLAVARVAAAAAAAAGIVGRGDVGGLGSGGWLTADLLVVGRIVVIVPVVLAKDRLEVQGSNHLARLVLKWT